jgi:EmrB/QacA subfamily drug resistance transporter
MVLAALIMVLILASLDQSIVNTALPRMTSDLGGLAHISWVVMAFLLTSTVSTPIYGKLGDMYGRRRMLFVAIGIFLSASMLCGLARTMTQLILFRGLQGLGAGGLVTLAQTTIGDVVGPRARGRYQGLFTGAMAVSSVAGPLIGGLLTTQLSWRWVFYVNLPVGALALTMIAAALQPGPAARNHHIDYAGAALLVGGTVAGLLLLSWGGTLIPWRSVEALGLGSASAILIALFIVQERRAPAPLMNPTLFRNRSFSIGVAAAACMSFAMTGAMVFMSLYFQLVLGLDPAQAGLMLLPQIGVMILTSVIGGRLSSQTGLVKPFMLLGVGSEALGLIGCAAMAATGSGPIGFLVALAVLGFGMGMGMPSATVVIQNAAPRAQLGVATATMGFLRSLGMVLGVAVSGGAMTAWLGKRIGAQGADVDILHILAAPPAERLPVVEAYRAAIGLSMALSAAVMVAAFLLVLGLRSAPVEPRD